MAEDDRMRYSDIIEPDDSIEKLVKQLEELNTSYETMVNAIRAGADKIARSIRTASGATSEGRRAIDEAAASTSRLERAQRELRLALSDTGKQIAWLKAQTADANRATVEQQRYIREAVSSYDRLKSDLKEAVSLYKSLTEAEREDSAMGQQLLDTIINLKNQIKALDDSMRPHITALTEVEKAEQRLAFLQSAEGQRLLDLKARIAELTAARRQHSTSIDPVVQAQERLAYAQSEENQQLKLYTTLIQEANRVAQLNAQIASSAEGSYNRLSAQYALNKIKLNQMSAAEREAAGAGKALEEETRKIYEQMIKLQEATGNYRLSVGHYQKVWDGLGFSITQVVRELPAATLSLNTFFLGISNNIPMVIDEVNKLRDANKKLAAEGKSTVNITKQIISSLMGWNTWLVVVLTVLSMYGQQIGEWVTNLFRGKAAVMSTTEALKNINTELEKNAGNYGESMVLLKQLQREWNSLKTVGEQTEWIEKNADSFDKLRVAIENVQDAENVFNNNTGALITALKLRAKAAAAHKLAVEMYEKAFRKRNEKEIKKGQPYGADGEGLWDYATDVVAGVLGASDMGLSNKLYLHPIETVNEAFDKMEERRQERLNDLEAEATAAEKNADAYFDLAEAYEKSAQAELKSKGIKEPNKEPDKEPKSGTSRGRRPRDLTDTINRNQIIIQRQYEESLTKLRKDEYSKRAKAASDQVRDANNRLREMYRKNVEYVNNVGKKYKQLTESQKKQIAQQQEWLKSTVTNNLQILKNELEQIEREQQINTLKIRRETANAIAAATASATGLEKETVITPKVPFITQARDASDIEQSLVQERNLAQKNLELEYQQILDTNKKLREEGRKFARSEGDILIELNKKKLELWSEYDQKILNLRAQNIEDQLSLVEKGSKEELELLLKQNEIRRQIALAENAAKPAAEQQPSTTINALFDKSGAQIKGKFEMTDFDEQQALDRAIFNEVKRSETEITRFKLQQEKARWEKQIALAEAGALDWSQKQIDAAKSTVKGIENELSDLDDFIKGMGKKGFGHTLLEKLGLNDEQISALEEATNIVIDQFKAILDAEVELAEKAVELSEKRVEAAQKAYDAEVEARNNGYANNVATAKRELEQEKKKQQQKQKILEAAQKRQEALNSITQASSLITASANLWSAFSSIPFVGPALALAAIATMWTSFAVAKIKAKQVTSQSEEYGEGGLEFLEGGSHASGNDIDLKTKNRNGKNMRAEGGEALAIINKKRTRKYKRILPDIVDSLNKGTFEDKYLNAFGNSEGLNISLNSNRDIDLSKIENDVRSIRKQNETKYYTMPDGTIIMQYKNVKRIIKK